MGKDGAYVNYRPPPLPVDFVAPWITLDAMMSSLTAAIPHDLAMRAGLLAIAIGLDAGLAPYGIWQRIPHPVAACGKAIAFMERIAGRRTYSGKQRRLFGIITIAVLVLVAGAVGGSITAIAFSFSPAASIMAEIALVAILLAARSMDSHVRLIIKPLRGNRLPAARIALAMIVGRDTGKLDCPAITGAAVESVAENLSDGVIAPAFYYLLFGLPGICAYKMLNTADSMTGYKSPRHLAYGWGAARLDDLANLVPARLTALLIACTGNFMAVAKTTWRDGRLHASPNAAYPIAAMAAHLGVRLGGARHYHGRKTDSPVINSDGRAPEADDLPRALATMWRVVAVFGAIMIATGLTGFI